MYKVFALLIVCALVLGMSSTSVLAEDATMNPAEIIEAAYEAVAAKDIDAAMAMVADDMVLTIIPPPGRTSGVFIGKDEVRAWWEGLAQDNGRAEFSNINEAGNMASWEAEWYSDHFDALVQGPAQFEGTNVVQDGLLKAATWVFTKEFLAKENTAYAKLANEELVRRILQEIWSEGNLDLIPELVAEDYVSHTWPIGEGRDDFKQDVLSWRTDFPGGTIVVDRIVFDGNRAIIFSHIVGPGGSLDEPVPEGEIGDVLIYQVENGRLSDRWYFAPFDPTE